MNPGTPPPQYTPSAPGAGAAIAAPPQPDKSGYPSHPQPHPQPHPHPQSRFPASFNLYTTTSSTFGGRSYTLGAHQSQPLYAVSLHSGLVSGKPDTILYSGASDKTTPLATADRAAFGSATAMEVLLADGTRRTYHARSGGGWPHRTFQFDVEVVVDGRSGNGSEVGRRETFEWRHSKGGEVRALGGQSSGWKLVRLGGGGRNGGGGGGVVAKSRDGNEVLAVWSHARMSLSKVFCFQFLGSGLSGELGERWAVLAVLTAIRMWDRERRARTAGAAGAAGSGGGGGGGGA